MEYRIISIGALDIHPLRGERTAVRTGHATTTLVRSGQTTILVDPGLPPQPLAARLEERTGLKPGDEVTFRYRFLFHEGDVKQADIPAQYDAFAGKSASK